MDSRFLRLSVPLGLAMVLTASKDRAEETIRGPGAYQVNLSAEQQQEARRLARATSNEHPLARMERLAHDYAYGDGATKGWSDPRLLARMKMDGFTVVETLVAREDGLALMVVKDERTGRRIVAFRGTEVQLSRGEKIDVTDLLADVAEVREKVNVGITQFGSHSEQLDRIARMYGRNEKIDVVGHSLGGSLANLFTANYPQAVGQNVTFQAPAVTRDVLTKYDVNLRRHPEAASPQCIAVVASGDLVSRAGSDLLPGTRVQAVDSPGMGLESHSNLLWQNRGLTRWDGSPVNGPSGPVETAVFDGAEFAELRRDFVIDGDVNPISLKRKQAEGTAMIAVMVAESNLEELTDRWLAAKDPARAAAAKRLLDSLWDRQFEGRSVRNVQATLKYVRYRLDTQTIPSQEYDLLRDEYNELQSMAADIQRLESLTRKPTFTSESEIVDLQRKIAKSLRKRRALLEQRRSIAKGRARTDLEPPEAAAGQQPPGGKGVVADGARTARGSGAKPGHLPESKGLDRGRPGAGNSRETERGPEDGNDREASLAEFRRLWTGVLERELGRNPQHSRVEMIANAQEVGPNKYRCAYNWWCWVKTSQGQKESVGYRHDRVLSLESVRSDVALWKRLYGPGGK